MACLAFAGCHAASPYAARPATDVTSRTHTDVAGVWRLTATQVGNSSAQVPDSHSSTSLRLYGEGTNRWGQAISGCQVGSVRLDVDAEGALEVESNGYMKSCPPPGYDALDGQYLRIVSVTIDLAVHGDHLIITGPRSRLVFAREDHARDHARR